jgi:hypothetical protein
MGDKSLRTARSHKANPFLIDRSFRKNWGDIGYLTTTLRNRGAFRTPRYSRSDDQITRSPSAIPLVPDRESFEGSRMRVSEG